MGPTRHSLHHFPLPTGPSHPPAPSSLPPQAGPAGIPPPAGAMPRLPPSSLPARRPCISSPPSPYMPATEPCLASSAAEAARPCPPPSPRWSADGSHEEAHDGSHFCLPSGGASSLEMVATAPSTPAPTEQAGAGRPPGRRRSYPACSLGRLAAGPPSSPATASSATMTLLSGTGSGAPLMLPCAGAGH
jgi:hypothetical protein